MIFIVCDLVVISILEVNLDVFFFNDIGNLILVWGLIVGFFVFNLWKFKLLLCLIW